MLMQFKLPNILFWKSKFESSRY